jgi:hypothetical protein
MLMERWHTREINANTVEMAYQQVAPMQQEITYQQVAPMQQEMAYQQVTPVQHEIDYQTQRMLQRDTQRGDRMEENIYIQHGGQRNMTGNGRRVLMGYYPPQEQGISDRK